MAKFLLPVFLVFYTSMYAQNSPADVAAPPTQFGTFSVWSQRLDMSQYVGKKYRLIVAMRAEPATPESFAVAFIRNEPPKGGLRSWTYMDNMMDHPVRDKYWKTYTLEYVVDKDAPWIGFGILAYSNGVFYYDDLNLAVQTEEDHWTQIPVPNGGFEEASLEPWQQSSQGVPVRILGAAASISIDQSFEGKQCLRVQNTFLLKE